MFDHQICGNGKTKFKSLLICNYGRWFLDFDIDRQDITTKQDLTTVNHSKSKNNNTDQPRIDYRLDVVLENLIPKLLSRL